MPMDGTSDTSSRPLSQMEAVRRASALVQELKHHCDDYGRLMQQRGGEAQEQAQQNWRHLRRMESSPLRVVRPRGERASGGGSTGTARGHDVDREGEAGGGNALNAEYGGEVGEDIGLTALMQGGAAGKKRPNDDPVNTHLTTSVCRFEPRDRATSSTTGKTERETHDEAYHRLRCCMGVAEEETEPTPQASGFSRLRLEEV